MQVAKKSPEIAKEWDYEKNKPLTPDDVTFGSNKKAWWICPEGHSFCSQITDRTGKHKVRCPYCTKKRKTIIDD